MSEDEMRETTTKAMMRTLARIHISRRIPPRCGTFTTWIGLSRLPVLAVSNRTQLTQRLVHDCTWYTTCSLVSRPLPAFQRSREKGPGMQQRIMTTPITSLHVSGSEIHIVFDLNCLLISIYCWIPISSDRKTWISDDNRAGKPRIKNHCYAQHA